MPEAIAWSKLGSISFFAFKYLRMIESRLRRVLIIPSRLFMPGIMSFEVLGLEYRAQGKLVHALLTPRMRVLMPVRDVRFLPNSARVS